LQIVVSVLCNPPKQGDPSYELFQKERSEEFASLQRRAKLVSEAFNSLPNMSVVPTAAAMYAFPEVGADKVCAPRVLFGKGEEWEGGGKVRVDMSAMTTVALRTQREHRHCR
jgi:aspartate/methionine/tyrosine aminotransferase